MVVLKRGDSMDLFIINLLVIAIGLVVLYLLPILVIYKKYLTLMNKWYSLVLLLYPFIIYWLGKYAAAYGRDLNIEDLEARRQAGEEIIYTKLGPNVDGPGDHWFYWGFFTYYLAIYPVILLILFLIIRRFFRRKKQFK